MFINISFLASVSNSLLVRRVDNTTVSGMDIALKFYADEKLSLGQAAELAMKL